jgi:hypothetical protein
MSRAVGPLSGDHVFSSSRRPVGARAPIPELVRFLIAVLCVDVLVIDSVTRRYHRCAGLKDRKSRDAAAIVDGGCTGGRRG